MMGDIVLSKYQQDILDYYNSHPHDNIFINALAGSGKSYTLLTLLENTTTSDIYVAFNNSIAKEFQSKIKNPKLKAKTLHSVGYSIMQYNIGANSVQETSDRVGFGKKPEKKKTGPTKVELDNLKSHKIVDELIDRYHGERCNFEFRVWLKNNYVQLYMLCRNTVTSFDNIYAIQKLIEDYNLFSDEGDTPFYPPDINTISQWLQEIHRISTEQFNQFGKIDFADMLYITWEKLCSKEWSVPGWSYYTNIAFDECLPGETEIRLENNDSKRLCILYEMFQKKQKLPKVKSFNDKTEQFEYKDIVSVSYKGIKPIYLIKTEGLNRIRATANHRFLTQRGYVRVDELIPGKDLLFLDSPENQKTKWLLNDDQFQLVLASSIGDGHIDKQSIYPTYRIGFTQGDAQINYFHFKMDMMNCTHEEKVKSGYTGKENINQTMSKNFALFDDIWNLMDQLDERFLAIWYQDDGSAGRGYLRKDGTKTIGGISISCNNLNEEQVDKLIDIIKNKFNIVFEKYKNRTYWEIRLNKENTVKFLSLIAPYMNKDCAYKNPYFDENNLYQWDNKFKSYGANYITSIEYIGEEPVYDMEVKDNHNFCCAATKGTKKHRPTAIISHNCQDATTLQLYFIKFIKRKGGRYVFCGDSQQAIYYFASSNANNYEGIKKMFAPVKEFTLPICYRCPTSHLKRVNEEYNIPILPRDNAPEGFIKTIKNNEIKNYIQPGDMIISRKNKYLPEVILQMSIAGIPIYIEDKDFVDRVKKIAKKTKLNSLKSLENNINKSVNRAKENILNLETFQKETEGMTKEEQENLAQEKAESNSQVDSSLFLLKIIDSYLNKYPMASVEEFRIYLDKLLNTYPRPDAVRICSIHKAKGLEADNVFVLNEAKYEYLPFASPEQNQQEKNLSYIATTRARNGLYLVKLSDLTQAKEDKKKAHSLEKILNKKKAQKEKGRK